jgi:hypothetical protein
MLREADGLAARGQVEQASWLFDAAARLDPGNAAVRDRLAGIAAASLRERTKEVLRKATERLAAGDFAGAMALLDSLPPAEAAASEVLALRNRIDRDRAEASRQLRARELAEAVAAVQQSIGQGDLRSARSELEKLRARYPEEANIREWLELVGKRIDEADRLRAVAAIASQAAALIRAGRTSEARAALERGLLEYPGEAELLRLLDGIAPPEPAPETREDSESRPEDVIEPAPAPGGFTLRTLLGWYIVAAGAVLTVVVLGGVSLLLRHPEESHPAPTAQVITPAQPVLPAGGGQPRPAPALPEPLIGRFTADSQKIEPGQGVWLRWSVSNSRDVTIEPGIGKVEPSGARYVRPAASTTYSLLARGAGKPSERRVRVDVTGTQAQPEPIIDYFYISPARVAKGGSAALYLSVSNATSVTIEPGIGAVNSYGSRLVYPANSGYYTLTATGPGGTRTKTTTVEVTVPQVATAPEAQPAPVIDHFYVYPKTVAKGQTTTFYWSVSNSTSVTIDGGVGAVNASGSRPTLPTNSGYYTLTATGPGGTRTQTTTVEVTVPQAQPAPVIDRFSIFPTKVAKGEFARLYWSVSNSTSVTIDPGIGAVSSDDSRRVYPANSGYYTLTATGPGGTKTQTTTVEVTVPQSANQPGDSQPASGSRSTTKATKATKTTKARSTLARVADPATGSFEGTVRGHDGKPIAGATVLIQGVNYHWQVATDSGGTILTVDGPGALTCSLRRTGRNCMERQKPSHLVRVKP